MKYQLPKLFFAAVVISIIIFSCANTQKSYNTIQKEGKVTVTWIRPFVNIQNDVKEYTYNIWYLDSMVIIEYVQIEFDLIPDPNKKIEPAFLKTKKYVFFDLVKMQCQDYKNFDTAAIPINMYKLNKEDVLLWNFYSLDSFPFDLSSYLKVSDTLINETNFKRVKFNKSKMSEKNLNRIVFMTNEYKDNIFHLSLSVDNIFSPLKVMRYDDYIGSDLVTSVSYKNTSLKLSNLEKEVFLKWKKNAEISTLPITNFADLPNN